MVVGTFVRLFEHRAVPVLPSKIVSNVCLCGNAPPDFSVVIDGTHRLHPPIRRHVFMLTRKPIASFQILRTLDQRFTFLRDWLHGAARHWKANLEARLKRCNFHVIRHPYSIIRLRGMLILENKTSWKQITSHVWRHCVRGRKHLWLHTRGLISDIN